MTQTNHQQTYKRVSNTDIPGFTKRSRIPRPTHNPLFAMPCYFTGTGTLLPHITDIPQQSVDYRGMRDLYPSTRDDRRPHH